MRVHKNSQKWITPTKNSDHFCFNKLFVKLLFTKRKRRANISDHGLCLAIIIYFLCNVQLSESLNTTTLQTINGRSRDGNSGSVKQQIVEVSPIGSGIIKGFLRLNSSVSSVSSSTLSSLLTAVGDEYTSLPLTSPNTLTTSYPVPKTGSGEQSSSKGSRKERFSSEAFSSLDGISSGSSEPSSAESRRKIKQYIPDSLLVHRNSRQGRRQIRDRARFLVGSLTRQNCFSKVICGLGARQPSTKTDLLNDYVYLMNELMVDDDDEEAKALQHLKQKQQLSSIESKSASSTKKKKNSGFSLFTRGESSEEDPKLRSQPTGSTAAEDEDDYNPIYAQIADEELVADDPAILKFMEIEAKKRKKFEQKMRHDFRGGYPYPYPPMARYPRNMDPSENSTTFSNVTTTVPPAIPEGRTSRSRGRQTYRKGPRYYAPNTAPDLNQFISKRRLQFQNEKDFKKRLSLAADTGRTLGFRNQRQCRSIFNDCPLDDKQIDSLVQGLRRVMDNGGNIAAIMPPTTPAQPAAIQAATNALQKTAEAAAASAVSQAAPGSKVEIILHLNQNGVPYATQTQQGQPAQGQVQQGPSYPSSPYHGAHPSQIPPPYVSPYHQYPGQQQQHQPNYVMTPAPQPPTTTTVKPVPEEQLLDFLYGVVNFNSTEPSLADEEDAFDWLVAGEGNVRQPVMHTLKEMMKMKNKPVKGPDSLADEYIETPLKVRDKGGFKKKKKPMGGKEAALQAIFDKMKEKDREEDEEEDDGLGGGIDVPIMELPPPPEAGAEGELGALKDYLGSLKETLLGLYQMNNASLAVENDLFQTDDKSSEESKESVGISKESEEEDFFEISGTKKKKKPGEEGKIVGGDGEDSDEEDDKDTEVLLKRPDPNKKRKKKKKGQEVEEEESSEVVDEVDDEKVKEVEGEKIFDDDEEDNKVAEKKVKPKPTQAPAKKPGKSQAKRPNKPAARPQGGGGKKKKKPEVDDEDEVKEVDKGEEKKKKKKKQGAQDQVAEEEEEEEEDDEYEEDDGSEEDGSEEGEEEEEYEEEEEEEDEDEEESRKTGGSKARPPPRPASKGQGGEGQGSAGKVDPTKITLIFAPSGSGPDKVGSAMEDSDIGSEERKKLATLTEVLLPTAAAPRPLSPKRPIRDKDDKPVVPAARPVYKEFEKVGGNFNRDTKIVNMHDFNENSPQHPTFHKKTKKRPKYRNPAKKKKRVQNNGHTGYIRPGLGRPVGEHGPPEDLRPPRPDPSFTPPKGEEETGGGGGEGEDDEQAQDDDGGDGGEEGEAVSGEGGGGSSEELEYEDDEENLQQEENGPPHHGGPPPPRPSPPSDEEQGSDEEEDEEEYEDDGVYDDGGGGGGRRKKKRKKGGQGLVEFGPGQVGHVRLPGPGPVGVGRLPPKHRTGLDSKENGGGEDHPQDGDVKTLIAVPYFREKMETQYAEGHPAPELVATGTIAEGAPGSSLLGNFFGMMGMKQVTEGPGGPEGDGGGEGPHRPHMSQHYYNHRPYAVSWEDGRTPGQSGSGAASTSLEEESSGQVKKNESAAEKEELKINGKGDLEEDEENLPPRRFKSTINVDTSQEDDEDEFKRPSSSWGTGVDQPEWDVDEDVQDDKKKGKKKGGGGKKKDKDKDDKKKKKKKKKKRKRKKGHGVVSQMHWQAGNPSLFVEGHGIEPILTELKKYVTSVTGSLLYLPPKERVKAPILLSDNPEGREPIPYQPPPPPLQPRPHPVHIHHHHQVPGHGGGWDDDDSSSEEDCKGKGKGKKKKKKGNDERRMREGRGKKKKGKKKGGGKKKKKDSCEGWSSEEDGKKGKGKKKGEEREDLLVLADLIGGGPLIIDPSQSPQEALDKRGTVGTTGKPETTTEEVWRGWRTTTARSIDKSPWRYKVTKRPKTTTENIFKAQVQVQVGQVETGGLQNEEGGEGPSKKESEVGGNIGIPITLFETTTDRSMRSTTPRLDVTTLKALVPKPTRKRLMYKTPAGAKGANESKEKGPMVGTVYSSMLKTTVKPFVKITKEKEDDEHEGDALKLKPLPDGLFEKKPDVSAEEVVEEEEEEDYDGDSKERQGRRPYKHKLSGISGSSSEGGSGSGGSGGVGGISVMTRNLLNRSRRPLSEVNLPSSVLLPGGVRGYGERDEEEEEETEKSELDSGVIEKMSKLGRGGLGSGLSGLGIASGGVGDRKKNKMRDRTRNRTQPPKMQTSVGPSLQLPPPPLRRNHEHRNNHRNKYKGGGGGPPPSSQPPTTGWSGLKNLSIRNFLSRYGNNLLDKTMAAYNNGR